MSYVMYLRKSRADGEQTVEQVLAKHEIQLQEYAARYLDGPISEEFIFREVVSGETIDDRPEMLKVLSMIETPKVEGVIVIEPQRLTRGDLEDCGRIIRAFRYSSTLVMTPMKSFDLTNEFDRDYFEMELMSGKKFLEYTKKILNRGREASVNRGNYIGTFAPFGYQKIKIGKDPTLEPNENADYVRFIFNAFVNEGLSMHGVAEELNKMNVKPPRAEYFSAYTIREILLNPIYIGKLRWNYRKTVKIYENGEIVKKNPKATDYIIADGKHPAIIDEEIYEKAVKKVGTHNKVTKKNALVNPLAGVFFCKSCGRAMTYREYNNKGISECKPRYHCVGQTKCHTKSATFEMVMDALVASLDAQIDKYNLMLINSKGDSNKVNTAVIDGLKNDLKLLDEKQERLYAFLEDGTYSKELFKVRNDALAAERQKTEDAIEYAESNIQSELDYRKKIATLTELVDFIKDSELDAKNKNDFIKNTIDRIDYSRADNSRSPKNAEFALDLSLKL